MVESCAIGMSVTALTTERDVAMLAETLKNNEQVFQADANFLPNADITIDVNSAQLW